MYHLKKVFVAVSLLLSVSRVTAQDISAATDVSLLHNFSEHAHFWTLGQTVRVSIAVNQKESFYGWLNYYKPGRFSYAYNEFEKAPGPVPSNLLLNVNSEWRFREISLGWKHYFLGSYNNYNGWNVYGMAGFGLIFNRVQNTYTTAVDTSAYTTDAPLEGVGKARRLTLDLGLGVEYPIGGYTFLYAETRSYIPASSTTSPYVFGSGNTPFPVLASVGVRILFGE